MALDTSWAPPHRADAGSFDPKGRAMHVPTDWIPRSRTSARVAAGFGRLKERIVNSDDVFLDPCFGFHGRPGS